MSMRSASRVLLPASLLEQSLLGAVALGLVAMLSFPAMRGTGETLGWLPFWLPALPLTAWATARLLRLRDAAELAARPSARLHRLASARPRADAGGPRALRRAA
jgi:hypothetical protein